MLMMRASSTTHLPAANTCWTWFSVCLAWAQLKAKVPKCWSLVLQASTGKRAFAELSIGGQTIPPVEEGSFKFLGMPVRVSRRNNTARVSIKDNLRRMMGAIDEAPLTRQQKLCLFKYGVCPRLAWPLSLEDLSTTWLERELQPLATRALKKWAGLSRSSNTSILFLPGKKGGLALPSLLSLHRKMQVTRFVQLCTSSDPGVRKSAQQCLEEERRGVRRRFKPALLVEELLSGEPRSRQAVSRAAKRILTEEEAETSHQALCQLPAQGAMARLWEKASPELWVKAVQGLPPEPLKFALNASLDKLPTNANLHTWGKKPHDICPLCQDYRQSLLHVLNHCKVAMDLRQYSRRHDEVLNIFGDFVQSWLPPI